MRFMVEAGFLFAILYSYPWFGEIGDELRLAAAAALAITFALTLECLLALASAPAKIWRQEKDRADKAEIRLRPSLRIYLPDDEFQSVQYGTTTTAISGHKQTVSRPNFQKFACVWCENISEAALEGCEAYIVAFRVLPNEGEEYELGIDAIPVPWIDILEGPHFRTTIPSGGRRTSVPIKNIHGHLYFHSDKVPVGYVQGFIAAGLYTVTMSMHAPQIVATKFQFQIDLREEDGAKIRAIVES